MSIEEEFENSKKSLIEGMSFLVTYYDQYSEGYSQPGTSTLSVVAMSAFIPCTNLKHSFNVGKLKSKDGGILRLKSLRTN